MILSAYTLDLMIALEEGEQSSPQWWADRYAIGAVRSGGLPPETPAPKKAKLLTQTDPESGEQFVRVTLPLPATTQLGRARELAHTLTSVMVAEGYTLRSRGKLVESLPGELTDGSLGPLDFKQGRVCSSRCLSCVFSSDSRLGCCGEGGAFSLADIGAALLDGDDQLVAACLALPGQMDGVKWHPHLVGGACVYHDVSSGCTLPPDRMPLQCRAYVCLPDKLLPAPVLADYSGYVEALEEAESFIEDHMREVGGVEFGSPLDQLKSAAAKAFAAWDRGAK